MFDGVGGVCGLLAGCFPVMAFTIEHFFWGGWDFSLRKTVNSTFTSGTYLS